MEICHFEMIMLGCHRGCLEDFKRVEDDFRNALKSIFDTKIKFFGNFCTNFPNSLATFPDFLLFM